MRSRSLDKTNPARVCAGLTNLGSRQNSSQPGTVSWRSLVFVKAIVIALGKRKRKPGMTGCVVTGQAARAHSARASRRTTFTSHMQHNTKRDGGTITSHGFGRNHNRAGRQKIVYSHSSKNLGCLIWQAARVPCLLLCHSMRRKILCESWWARLSQKSAHGFARFHPFAETNPVI